jgi:DUF4097 and DUF4098 domain-containing protein YvlB
VLAALLLTVSVAASPAQPLDTTVVVTRGDRLVIEDVTGSVAVTAWDRDAVQVVGDDGDQRIGIRKSGATLNVVGGAGGRRGRSVDAVIRVPSWMDLSVRSRSMDVVVMGVDGAIEIANVNGDVAIDDVGGAVNVSSVDGDIVVRNARGPVSATSQSDDVTMQGVSGPIDAHSGDGDVVLADVSSASVRVEAQDGDVVFSGMIVAGGDYGFYLHDGDATIAVPSSTSARVSVSTFDGEFHSDFTVRVERFSSGRQFDFVLGDGGAQIDIEVFDGDIHLARRP